MKQLALRRHSRRRFQFFYTRSELRHIFYFYMGFYNFVLFGIFLRNLLNPNLVAFGNGSSFLRKNKKSQRAYAY